MKLSLHEQRRIVFDQIKVAEKGGMSKVDADDLRDKVQAAGIEQLLRACTVEIGSTEFLTRIAIPKMQGGEYASKAGEKIVGFGRNTKVKSKVDVPKLQAHIDGAMKDLIKKGAALFYGQAFSGGEEERRAPGFLGPKAVEAAFISERKGLTARVMVYQADLETKPFFVLFSNDDPTGWKVQVYSTAGDIVAAGRGHSDEKLGVAITWGAAAPAPVRSKKPQPQRSAKTGR